LLGTAWQERGSYASAGLPYNAWCFWAPLSAVFICICASVAWCELLKRFLATRTGVPGPRA